MTHAYKITGMTCGSCEEKVKSALLRLPGITGVDISREKQSATITMEKHITVAALQAALDKKYTITEQGHAEPAPAEPAEPAEPGRSLLEVYKPVLLLFIYITAVSVIAGFQHGSFHLMKAMNVFMAGFFLSFSFFKMLDLASFADSYSTYDLVARRFRGWAYLYVWIEVALGAAYATGFQPVITNLVTLVVMTVSIAGVLQSVLNKRKIRCACLGSVFNLPMSTVTIIEDGAMILMSAIMLVSTI